MKRLTKITVYIECSDTPDASDWRNEAKFHTRISKGIKGIKGVEVKGTRIETWNGVLVNRDPRNNADDAYAAFMSMGQDEWQGLLLSLLGGGVLQPAEQIGFERALMGPDSRDSRDRA